MNCQKSKCVRDHHDSIGHEHMVWQELICHLPYAVFSVASSLVVLSFFSVFTAMHNTPAFVQKGASILFHSFHFMHIVFAASGTLITYFRFSKSWQKALIVGIFSPIFFCMMSDAVLPYIGGRMLGVAMSFHVCFVSEWQNVLPFLVVGIITGFALGSHSDEKHMSYSLNSHASHIFISSLASTFYLVAHGFTDWYSQIGSVFLFLVAAVVIPCTFSDVIVPMIVARKRQN